MPQTKEPIFLFFGGGKHSKRIKCHEILNARPHPENGALIKHLSLSVFPHGGGGSLGHFKTKHQHQFVCVCVQQTQPQSYNKHFYPLHMIQSTNGRTRSHIIRSTNGRRVAGPCLARRPLKLGSDQLMCITEG